MTKGSSGVIRVTARATYCVVLLRMKKEEAGLQNRAVFFVLPRLPFVVALADTASITDASAVVHLRLV